MSRMLITRLKVFKHLRAHFGAHHRERSRGEVADALIKPAPANRGNQGPGCVLDVPAMTSKKARTIRMSWRSAKHTACAYV